MRYSFRNGIQNITVAFSKPETRSQWEENFNDAKQKLGIFVLGIVLFLN